MPLVLLELVELLELVVALPLEDDEVVVEPDELLLGPVVLPPPPATPPEPPEPLDPEAPAPELLAPGEVLPPVPVLSLPAKRVCPLLHATGMAAAVIERKVKVAERSRIESSCATVASLDDKSNDGSVSRRVSARSRHPHAHAGNNFTGTLYVRRADIGPACGSKSCARRSMEPRP